MSDLVSRNRVRSLLVLSCLSLIAVLCWWWNEGRPQPVAEAADDKLQCLSYAPFRKPGETPLDPESMVSEERLRQDLTILSARTQCVRTYSVIQGLDAVPGIARELGMQVLLGAWIGRERDKNEIELNEAIRLANEYPDTVRGVIVGNEVLLRREQSPKVMADYIDRVKAAVEVPVTYADVWEFWSQHSELARHVSFVTVHILPYWEDHPVGIHDAIQHIVGTAEAMRKLFDGKDVLIGETGWPSAGRQRDAAVAGRVNQARFLRNFSLAAAEHNLNYNFIEAFDQPWKRGQEGAMGGNWGVFDSDGEAKFPATGPVEEDPFWYWGWVGALAGAVMLALLAKLLWRSATTRVALAASAGAVTGALVVAQWRYLVVWNRNALEWSVTLLFCALGIVLVLAVLRLCLKSGGLGGRSAAVGSASASFAAAPAAPAAPAGTALGAPPVAELCRMCSTGSASLNLLGLLRTFFLLSGATMALLLVFDARYRGFPTVLYMLPVFGLMLAKVAGFRMVGQIEERLLAAICLLGAIGFVMIEGLANTESLSFAGTLVLMAALATDGRFWLNHTGNGNGNGNGNGTDGSAADPSVPAPSKTRGA
ncbi:MAG: hypothetical protein Q4A16_06075 [Lautropia sp.]|nr:hypothetical protein [Lautropia sp.]